ncbi:MAG: hypothetical protein ACM3N3_00240, partial [Betaproteobacteria bacterium]
GGWGGSGRGVGRGLYDGTGCATGGRDSRGHDNPGPGIFEAWLLDYIEKEESRHSPGAVSAMARAVLDESRLAHSMNDFEARLNSGALREDASAALAASSWMR